jgi:hypothetical protein
MGCVHGVDQNTFVVALAALDFAPEAGGEVSQSLVDLGERRTPVYRGLALAQRVEVRTMEDQYLAHRAALPRARWV